MHGIAISSTYFSDASVEQLEPLFTDQLVVGGWQKTRADEFMGHEIHEFEMEPYRISIQFGGIGRDPSYSIWCEDSRTMR